MPKIDRAAERERLARIFDEIEGKISEEPKRTQKEIDEEAKMKYDENAFKEEKSRTSYNNAARRLMDRFPCWECSRLDHCNGGFYECVKSGKCLRNFPERKTK